VSDAQDVTSAAADGERPDSELILQAFDELAASIALFSGPEHRVRAVNRAVYALTGPGRELMGQPFAKAFHELGDQRIEELLDQVYETGRPVESQEHRMLFDRRGTGTLDEVYLSFSMHPTTVGSERGVLAHAVDVTEIVLARRAAEAAADRSAAQYRSAREVVWALQRSMLPARLPLLPQVRMAAHYLVAGDENAAGGDWFDAVALDDGRVAVMVGDVVGHGPGAAGVMGQLRSVTTQLLLDGWGIAEALARLDRFAARLSGAAGSTVCLAMVDAAAGGLEYACCGHPPPLVVSSAGRARFLDLPGGGPLAVTTGPPQVAKVELGPDQIVLLYTDGLIERRHRPPREGVDLLGGVAASSATAIAGQDRNADPVDRLCESVLEGLTGSGYDDDVSVLGLRLTQPTAPLRLELPAASGTERIVRSRLHEWLSAVGVAQADALDLQLAVGEAVANVVVHAYPGEPGPVVVEVEHHRAGRVAVTVSDQGRWQRTESDGAHSRSGRGLRMMRETTDVCEIDRTPEGTVVSMDRTVGVPTVLRLTAGVAPDVVGADDWHPVAALCIERNSRSERAHLELTGWLDAAAVPDLRAETLRASRGGAHPLTLDLEAVTGIASAGVQLLYELAEMAPGGEALELRASPRSAAAHILGLVDLQHLIRTPAASGAGQG
jgi:PAS domain S-box-containing protein